MNTMLIVLGGAFVAFVLAEAVIQRMVRPVRMELADLGRQMIQSNIPDDEKKQINRMLDSAFSWRFMVRAVVLFPQFLFETVGKPEAFRKSANDGHPVTRLANRPNGERLFSLHMRSVMAANVPFTVLFILELFLGLPLLLIAGLGTLLGSFLMNSLSSERHDHHDGRMAH